jgi:hypothetical protein
VHPDLFLDTEEGAGGPDGDRGIGRAVRRRIFFALFKKEGVESGKTIRTIQG